MSQNFNPQNANEGLNEENIQNQMNMNMMNYINYMNMQNELLKCVMEGMGEQPSDNMQTNWNTIMNYVPTTKYLGIGPLITLIFEKTTGEKTKLKIGHDTPLKDAFFEFGKIAGINEDTIKTTHFLCKGRNISVNTPGTIRENGFKDQDAIVLLVFQNNN